MLALFQVITFDAFNQNVILPITNLWGDYWALYFIFFIVFMFFFCLNIILGGFVSYYSNAKMRVNFEYDYNFDDVLN